MWFLSKSCNIVIIMSEKPDGWCDLIINKCHSLKLKCQ